MRRLLLVCVLAGCGGGGSSGSDGAIDTPVSDSHADTPATTTDADIDAMSDAAPDALSDAAPDAMSDAALDAMLDAAPDAPAACATNAVLGDYHIGNTLDAAAFQGVTSLSGQLTMAGGLGPLSFPCLEHVGTIRVADVMLPRLTTVAAEGGFGSPSSAPALVSVGTDLYAAGTFDLRSLVTVGGNVDVVAATTLNGLSSLTSIGGTLTLGHSDAMLGDLTGLSHLTSVHDLGFYNFAPNATLHGLEGITSIPGTVSIGRFASGNEQLVDLTGLGNLTRIDGTVTIIAQSITALTALSTLSSSGTFTSSVGAIILPTLPSNDHELIFTPATFLSLPALTHVYSFRDMDSPTQTDLQAPVLRSVPMFLVRNDPHLPQCIVEKLVAQLSPPPVSTTYYGLDTTATCPP